jgi:hypothetical protein
MRPAAVLLLTLVASPAFAADPVDFQKHVYPILHDRCFSCHQGADAKSGVRLDQRAVVLTLVTPGKSAESVLIKMVSGDDPDRVMPPKGARLTAAQVQTLKDWIDQGVKWDDKLLPPEGAKDKHWAFQPVTRPQVPVSREPKASAWVRNPIDAYVLAKHQAKGLMPAPEADRRTLLRRLSFDLTGLPPTPEQIDAFVNDKSPDAYEKQVERLLASPAYGERWGRHWLDVARYADSEGYESDHIRPYAWRYRDWVVKAFNDDKPFDRFILEQLAGDELTPYCDTHLIATGFLAAARLSSNEEDRARQFNDMYVDIANATGSAFLGLTFNCAQCHDHKFDPISHRDYYRFQGFFLKGMPYNFALADPAGRREYEAAKPAEYDPARTLLRLTLDKGKAKLDAKARDSLTPAEREAYDTPADLRTPAQHALAVVADLKFQYTLAQMENAIPAEDKPLYAELKKKVAAIEAKLPDPPQTWGFYSPATSPHRIDVLPMRGFYPPPFNSEALGRARPFVLLAGDAHRRGAALDVGWPAFFGPTPPTAVSKHPRTALANWLTDPKNPLTARVWVNRIWHYHFGRGLVDTGGDFGLRGSPPSHPELLDWLASELMKSTTPASGSPRPAAAAGADKARDAGPTGQPPEWSAKHIHRLIVTSSTYRQSTRGDAASVSRDPDNRYLARWKPRRLEAEAVRDVMLAVSGELDPAIGGKPDTDETKSLRRGLYLLQKRQKPPAVQLLFDGPTGATESCPRRVGSVTPLSTLFLLNNPFVVQRAKLFANRVGKIAGDDREKQTETAFRLAFGRLPSAEERKLVAAYFEKNDEADPLVWLCHVLYLTNEFTTLE